MLRRTGGPVDDAPVHGQSYVTDQAFGNAEVIGITLADQFVDRDIDPNSTYNYALFTTHFVSENHGEGRRPPFIADREFGWCDLNTVSTTRSSVTIRPESPTARALRSPVAARTTFAAT